jgi:hypothetical protein
MALAYYGAPVVLLVGALWGLLTLVPKPIALYLLQVIRSVFWVGGGG